ncbi:hypothetical protein A2911_00625 [Candidatus Nomurabacteria bacterium RIFCSPLOWO2_01_FULL_40_15]|uniref:Uncharacterized protein n=1 Tax=Candidatus Nomurabacteria bacterium RIFCSPLOWO2_01_FULL_40_15 TaxID=1801772 RepID=A0A1F6X8I6_9BACT|nr:MAG: hypothetical protein A2911_00625 [Candidatus Nomurabacteria bacterium RIFCSPLOWO2_01_FULL_40_15]
MPEPKPPQPGEHNQEGPLPLSIKNQKMKDVFSAVHDCVNNGPYDQLENFMTEITSRVEYLRKKYPDWQNRTVVHIISSSTMDPSSEVIEEDFPLEDSVEAFIASLQKKYGGDLSV